MKVLLNAFYFGWLLLALSAVSYAKDWRGLVPLHSSREDVEKLLGPPHPPPADGLRAYTMHEGRSIYFLEEGEVYIVYTNLEDPGWGCDCAGAVPSGTVLYIKVTPKKEVALRDLYLDESKPKKVDPAEPKGIGFEGYADGEDGIVVRTYKGKVDEIYYVAAAKDRRLCPNYYEPEALIRVIF